MDLFDCAADCIYLLLFPEAIISLTFGAKYALARRCLRILSLGAIFITATALVSGTLVAFGQSRFVMISGIVAVVLDATLDILLIPRFSIEGAASASVIALVFWQLVNCLKLYSVGNMHLFGRNILKPLGVELAALVVLYYAVGHTLHTTYLTLILLFALFVAIYGLAVLLTGSLEQDIYLVTAIGDKVGINTERLRRWMTKFV